MARCIFCGVEARKATRSKEHIIPMWLLALTGDPHRDIRIEFDPDTGADIIRPASTFHFPACRTCNAKYGKDLEAKAHGIVIALSRQQWLSVSQCYVLLDWLDKVRVGLWLGYHALHKDIFEPRFRIDGRLGKKDRVAIISVDPDDHFKGFRVGGCDNNVFRTTQAGFYLRINNIRIVSLSTDLLVSRLAGLPHPKEFFLNERGMAVATMAAGDGELMLDWKPFTIPGAVVVAQPIITLSTDMLNVAEMYTRVEVLRHVERGIRSLKVRRGINTWPLQLISNKDGAFRYFPKREEKIRFVTAAGNSDAAFMHALYATFLQLLTEREPRRWMAADGSTGESVFGNYLFVQKLLQILARLEQLGVRSLDGSLRDDLIDEFQRLNRIREEIEAHAHGTLETGTEKPRLA